MKKMMMIAAALLVAGMTQAAAVAWGMNAVAGAPQIFGTGNVALPITSWANIIKYTGTFSLTTSGGAVTGWQAAGGSGNVAQSVAFGDGVSMATLKPGRFAATFDDPALTVGDKYAVVVFEAGTKDNYSVTTGKYDTYLFTVANATGEDFRWVASQTLSLTATPEPTSLALLAVGAAVIGLHRKFRK